MIACLLVCLNARVGLCCIALICFVLFDCVLVCLSVCVLVDWLFCCLCCFVLV